MTVSRGTVRISTDYRTTVNANIYVQLRWYGLIMSIVNVCAIVFFGSIWIMGGRSGVWSGLFELSDGGVFGFNLN